MKVGRVIPQKDLSLGDRKKLLRNINHARHEIGVCLNSLKAIKKTPDNFTQITVLDFKSRLGWALSLLATFKHAYPFLFRDSEQMEMSL